MLTRREKLLVRPWQLRRYNNHRKKVMSALPVIDFGPPPQRGHVALKLKKLQKEGERRTKIEEDNFRLLQRMGSIMKKNRLDNYWETKPPTFLGRVGIFHRTRSPTPCRVVATTSPPCVPSTRKSRCIACSSQLEKQEVIPEERVPWEPPKKSPLNRQSWSATAVTDATVDHNSKTSAAFKSNKTSGLSNIKHSKIESKCSSSISSLPLICTQKFRKGNDSVSEKHIVLEQGSLHLAVNFPIYVNVKVKSAEGEKYI